MLELLKFVFSDFWHYIGTLILIYVMGISISAIGCSFVKDYKNITYYESKNGGEVKKEVNDDTDEHTKRKS